MSKITIEGWNFHFFPKAATALRIYKEKLDRAIDRTNADSEDSEIVDLDGTADALVLDADGNTSISAPTDDQIDIEIGGNDDIVLTAGTLSFRKETARTIRVAATTTAATAGGALTINSGAGLTSGAGGALTITAGAGGATGNGGAIGITSGAGGATSGDSGHATFLSGNAAGNTGNVTVKSGNSTTSGNSGYVLITSGTVAAGTKGSIYLRAGGTDGWKVDENSNFVPEAAAASDLGSSSLPVRRIYAQKPFVAVSADEAITVPAYDTTYYCTKAGVAAMTIADPTATTRDGLTLTFVATTAQANTLSNAAGSGFNAGGAGSDVATFGGARGDNIVITAYQGVWYVVSTRNVTLG